MCMSGCMFNIFDICACICYSHECSSLFYGSSSNLKGFILDLIVKACIFCAWNFAYFSLSPNVVTA